VMVLHFSLAGDAWGRPRRGRSAGVRAQRVSPRAEPVSCPWRTWPEAGITAPARLSMPARRSLRARQRPRARAQAEVMASPAGRG